MTLLFVAFKVASLFGITDYYAIAMITNALLLTTTALMAALICKRLFGITQSVMALVCILLSPPFYFMAPVFYTDSLSMVFPVLVIYLYLKYADSTTHKNRVIFAMLMGLSCGVGMLVKFTVVIALVAVIIHHMLTNRMISSLRITAISAACVTAVLLSFNAYFYSAHLDRACVEELEVPYSHWIMMGLEGNGRYNPSDYEFTLSFDDKEEQKAAISDRIKERIKDRGLLGMLSLFYEKGIIIFGDGTYAQSDFLDDNPANDTALHSYILYDGEHYQTYQYLCSGVRFTLQLLMLISAYGTLLQRKGTYENMLPLLCMFGVMLFFMIWEVTGRYSTNFIPMTVIAAVSGLNTLMKAYCEKESADDDPEGQKAKMKHNPQLE
jgi:4-amino-4-deoxy-L-arabinose transferase and related glycosyltransferases of PMT family